MLTIDDKDIREFEADLKTFARRAYPFATKNTVNKAAFSTQKVARNFVKGKMIERNAFTKRSIQVDPARTLNVSHQAAIVGSTATYMEDQEFGGSKVKSGKHGVAIPTPSASGETNLPRKKLPRKQNKLQNLKMRKRSGQAKGRKQRNRMLIAQAAAAGGRNRFIFLDLGRRSGIFKVTGGKRKAKLTKIYDLTRSSVTIPKRPWLKPAVDKIQPLIPKFYRNALIFQLKRQGLFKS